MITNLLENLNNLGDKPAVQSLGGATLSYAQLGQHVARLQGELEHLARSRGKAKLRVGLYLENSPAWIVADLALLLGGHLEVPVPIGFTRAQCEHLLGEADVCLLSPDLMEADEIGFLPTDRRILVSLEGVVAANPRPIQSREIASDSAIKAIHTSGTTSTPKGVLISARALSAKVDELSVIVGSEQASRYLSVVPLSLLLEQICAIYLPLVHGGTTFLLPEQEKALTGGGRPASQYLRHIRSAKPTFLTVPPSIVEAIAAHAESMDLDGSALMLDIFGRSEAPLVACGGAPIAPEVLHGLTRRGLTVCEGYGLSENTSVVSWNIPGATKLGTVGRPLPSCDVSIALDGELLVRSPTLFLGYLGSDPSAVSGMTPDGYLQTGDLAAIDEDGFLRIIGRKKHIIINSSGRKISTDWIEAAMAGAGVPGRVVVFGDGYGYPVALVLQQLDLASDAVIAAAIRDANENLPDYAQVRNFRSIEVSKEAFQFYFTITGRPKRDLLAAAYASLIECLSLELHHKLIDKEV